MKLAVPALSGLAMLAAAMASAQAPPPSPAETAGPPKTMAIWDVALGTPIADLPRTDFVEPACGTNGGPRSRLLPRFADFAQCRKDSDTGLYEINFIYDDEREYLARATRDLSLIQAWYANQILGQPIVLSFLIDDQGLVQGYRIFTDDRAEDSIRHNAYILGQIFFKTRFGDDGWTCATAEPGPGEKAVGQRFINDTCEKTVGTERMVVTSRFYYRAGQQLIDPRTNTLMVGQYVSTASLEVVNTEALGSP